jgi:hypothetical protein
MISQQRTCLYLSKLRVVGSVTDRPHPLSEFESPFGNGSLDYAFVIERNASKRNSRASLLGQIHPIVPNKSDACFQQTV